MHNSFTRFISPKWLLVSKKTHRQEIIELKNEIVRLKAINKQLAKKIKIISNELTLLSL